MGFIELNKALCMLSVLTSTHVLSPQGRGRKAGLLFVFRLCLRRGQTDRSECDGPQGRKRLPRDARRRLRLGKTLQRAHAPALHGRLQTHHPVCTIPQRVWAEGHVEGRREKAPRPSAGRSSKPRTAVTWKSKFGATATDSQFPVHRRLRLRDAIDYGKQYCRTAEPGQQ